MAERKTTRKARRNRQLDGPEERERKRRVLNDINKLQSRGYEVAQESCCMTGGC
jgi:hypothetical protein